MSTRHPGLPGPRIVQAVLKDVNRVRARQGLLPMKALLRGKRHQITACPIARTLVYGGSLPGTVVIEGMLLLRLGAVESRALPTTRRFVTAFDNGKYPGLVLP